MWRNGSTKGWTNCTRARTVSHFCCFVLFILEGMPEEVNIDDLLDLPSDEERTHKLQVLLQTCTNSTEAFIAELLQKLHGLHKQEELQNEGIEHPCLHTYPHHHGNIQPHRGKHQHPTHQTL
ncbi:protein phosphatase 1 regulatory subunit 14A-like isoform X2 [Carassius carassius]|uniref:protein phosphatase 1 regulatory subunit 14A-like isoform X2 n=1 Tax=Carassius carassius TaxID=217509 RepID=UPI0028690EEF|nr:protein phosphatase 1 regulatory subunit 14A-like isoform X2 [Carassius carassius]